MHYTVEPGLYALGGPGPDSVVLVTANYKMSFDTLRRSVLGLDAWILVLDTRGINVWCAAGKGTFGTDELVNRIRSSGLEKVVTHRTLLLPQLGAPGVAALKVKKQSGFKALFGPIRAADLPAFLAAGWKATPGMRRKRFPLKERVVLIPIELVAALKYLAMLLPAFWLLDGILGPHRFWINVLKGSPMTAGALSGAVFAGTVLTPILLPWLPGRAFSFKGAVAGGLVFMALMLYPLSNMAAWALRLEAAAWFFISLALSAFLGMNFTGASTYTSLSGVKKEMKYALPMEIGAGAAGCVLWVGSRVMA